MDDTIFTNVYVCFQKAKATFGYLILRLMLTTRNLIIDASQSGKICWLRFELFPYAEQKSALLVDSLSPCSDHAVLELTSKLIYLLTYLLTYSMVQDTI
jgi:hypothetical protein